MGQRNEIVGQLGRHERSKPSCNSEFATPEVGPRADYEGSIRISLLLLDENSGMRQINSKGMRRIKSCALGWPKPECNRWNKDYMEPFSPIRRSLLWIMTMHSVAKCRGAGRNWGGCTKGRWDDEKLRHLHTSAHSPW